MAKSIVEEFSVIKAFLRNLAQFLRRTCMLSIHRGVQQLVLTNRMALMLICPCAYVTKASSLVLLTKSLFELVYYCEDLKNQTTSVLFILYWIIKLWSWTAAKTEINVTQVYCSKKA